MRAPEIITERDYALHVFASHLRCGFVTVASHPVVFPVEMQGFYLTPTEARGLANRLLKEAAEVEFAANCTKAVQS